LNDAAFLKMLYVVKNALGVDVNNMLGNERDFVIQSFIEVESSKERTSFDNT